MFGDDFKLILDNYLNEKVKNFKDNKFAERMRSDFTNNLKNNVDKFIDVDNYEIKISHGQGRWATIPWEGIRNFECSITFQDGLYVVYLFRKDMSGIYLSLNQGVTNIRGDKFEILQSRASNLKTNLKTIPKGFNENPIDLKDRSSKTRLYEAGNIISRFYSFDDLSNDSDIKKDIGAILETYESIIPYYKSLANWEAYKLFVESIKSVKESYNKAEDKKVFEKYGHIFHPDNLDKLSKEDFVSFLSFKNNKHWHGIQRLSTTITQDMDKLKEGLKILLDESKPINERFNELMPLKGNNYVKGLGRAILTPILSVVYPTEYGVYNSKAELAMDKTDFKPKFDKNISFGEEYSRINEILVKLAKENDLTLLQLDEVWDIIVGHFDHEPKIYWVTIGKDLQSNYGICMDNNVWGIKEENRTKATKLKLGDYLLIYSSKFGFTLCKIESDTFEGNSVLWSDDPYPIRVDISDPIYHEDNKPDEIHKCLLDANNVPYKNGSAWGRAIGGAGGILREIKSNEIECLFDKLGWNYPIVSVEQMEPLFLNPLDIDTKDIKLKEGILENICALLNSGKHILLTGPPGTGKTDLAKHIANGIVEKKFSEGYILTTATSDWSTFDTIGGYMPEENDDSLSFYEGKFLQAIKENKTLIIDEINRSDIDKAFGQLFTVLSGQGVELPFISDKEHVKIIPNDGEIKSCLQVAEYSVGNNWRIIATMNIFDKNSLFEMSYAFMRRFAFVYIDLPEDIDYKNLIKEWTSDIDNGYTDLIDNLLKINDFRPMGPAILKDICEFVKARVQLSDSKNNINTEILVQAFISFIVPQLEGLLLTEIKEIWKSLDEYLKQDPEIIKRFKETGFNMGT
ncbi:MrcB family domain-containing protein [Methanobacterium spitsbergense]|uniref:DUF3578 domain-containing protein n=1 Tax=Methanobacterium spitsbergense TaxID=2874285 RepID=A0A8T5UVE9_9EURY|nr:DUF3578 domain-containing protein [Methanobacterium spitsbergense]MBZ2165896.1 DUF3578 domain-containing protein [Methanobacterium spitsbergense]